MFTVRTVFVEQQRVEASAFEIEPSNEQGQAVCSLFLEFLSEQPPEFRAKLPFLKQGEAELEWASAAGGAALASFYEAGEPLSMGILLAGVNEEADAQMIAALRQSVLEPVFGSEADALLESPERPLMINVIFPGNPELTPRVQLLATALASVFFRVMRQMSARSESAPGKRPG